MSRPFGSKNKPKEEVSQETSQVVAEAPRRTMPVVVRGPNDCVGCGHDRMHHYGGPRADIGGWCHIHGCDCKHPK